MFSTNSPQQENFSTPPDNANKFIATRILFPLATHSLTSSPYNSTPTTSPNISNLPDANEVLDRPQLNNNHLLSLVNLFLLSCYINSKRNEIHKVSFK